MPSNPDCPVAAQCIAIKFKYNENQQLESSPPQTSHSSLTSNDESCRCKVLKDQSAQANDINLSDTFWDSLITFMQESCKVMEKFKPEGLTSAQKDAKMKELLRKIEEKENEIKQLGAEFRELVPPKQCPSKQGNFCPVTQGGECPEPNCDNYDEDFYDFNATTPTPYQINQNYSQYPSAPMYPPNVQSLYSRGQPEQQYTQLFENCDGMCQKPCQSNCPNVCNQRQQPWKQYQNMTL
ncbi:uncharacterized protein LOC130899421 isoform X2 [Diorhabda carinulata]|uniref:uncharacterized protein LOC130899421 isoform X2 n=1 Tax=Diorhabda carinulata TaxID=1163345 RepID=UPI0025A267B2|nr:uncharacterized protein LOC130899421 isoform X2 [Diorhabda carinulata]